jgi:hypothetical protein
MLLLMLLLWQVLCNGGVAMELSLLYLLDIGSLEVPVDFRNHYRSSWLGKCGRSFVWGCY